MTRTWNKLRASEFPSNHTWFNAAPISLERDLKGKITLIDFWTYCCINCLHVLPDLEYLEQKFQSESSIVFIGCHSAKFKNEKSSDKVRDAVLKYSIHHPVINDDKMLVWRSFERHSWPSIVILSPKMVPIFVLTGEGHRQVLDIFLSVAYDYYYNKLNHKPVIKWMPEEKKEGEKLTQIINNNVRESPEEHAARQQNFRYPAKILCIEKQSDLDRNLIIVSDTGNNRIVIINEDTMTFEDQIGNGKIGLVDGSYSEAQLHHPQGICHVFREG